MGMVWFIRIKGMPHSNAHSVGASLAARFKIRIKSVFTTEGAEFTEKTLFSFLSTVPSLVDLYLTTAIAPRATLLRKGRGGLDRVFPGIP